MGILEGGHIIIVLGLVPLFFLALYCTDTQYSSVILINGKIATMDRNNPWAEAVAIDGEKIIKVGKNEAVRSLISDKTKVIDLNGKLAIPGFNDAHLHFLSGGKALIGVNLQGCTTLDEIKNRIRAKINKLPEGAWINGRGWDHTLFNKGVWPDKGMLDKIASNNPVYLRRLDGHSIWVNSLALKAAGITQKTHDPAGGEIFKDTHTGEPTGILTENAMDLVDSIMPGLSKKELILAVKKAMEEARKYGVTSIQDNSNLDVIDVYKELLKKGELTVRVYEWLPFDLIKVMDKLYGIRKRVPKNNNMLRSELLKGFADGSMGSSTAYFFEPYLHDYTDYGISLYTQEELNELVVKADKAGFQMGIHAIGDKANHMVLNAYEQAIKLNGKRDSRHRIEHAQVARLQDIKRFSKLGVIASMQPTHCTDDMRWAEGLIGYERCTGAYAWRSFLDAEAKLAFGTDWPVEPLNPMLGIYAAVTRQTIEDGLPVGGWFLEQKLTVEETIRAYTLGSAYAEFQDDIKGLIENGKLADIVVLSDDIFTIPPKEILNTKVIMTILGGKIIYEEE
jgi:predicted amidohydrolase YtcJ